MDNLRAKFEAKFPVPAGVYWYESVSQYDATEQEYEPDADVYHWQWVVWQAATESARGGAEPVAWLVENTFTGAETLYRSESEANAHRCIFVNIDRQDKAKRVTPLYTHPPAPVAPKDWLLVPATPTPEMIEAALDAHMPFGDLQLAITMANFAAPESDQ